MCPITDTEYYPDHMRAAHLVPAALGELNCAYLFGRPVEDGWQILFNPNNGLLLNKEIQKAFDRAVLQVVPDLTAENQGFKVAYLADQGLLEIGGTAWSDELHDRDVEFRKGVKGPGIENLFVAALLAAFRRKRYDCPGWWEDYRKLFYEPEWPDTPLHLRESVLHVLAAMYGDSERFEELINRGTVRFQTISGTADQDETTALSLTAATPPPYNYKYTWTERDDWEGEKDWEGEIETLEDAVGHLTFDCYTAQQHIIELTKLYRKKDEESASMKGKYEHQIAELKQKIEEQKKWLAD
ncbi:hypothetical protein LTR10_019946 [Elasticomyces elasticus]|uniref:HNH nuclease domain-containing protein n=1 Tax=Exophiala sideris TaxID=1016849 RepID=A0ABR0J9L8_9EURO|nr:hypothetical protein LTR10_019946 [Elasticomyces elasticus]KAK5022782.1 hypothetical protein LTS07_009760 [Exophiala sideris]KAK5026684.1 hypothetical protein LTR13_009908 [Exophiala sideris]KAK5059409.1 hypothetical protein LTR69_005998 [Exophiala sideris]KAK5177446.1 hypothetical protein LTR44_010062 [Eurotiomycetes sp. CCFEE 6388]